MEDEGTFLALKQVETIPAGEPAIYILGDTLDYDAEDDYIETILLTVPGDSKLATESVNVNGLWSCITNHTLLPRDIFFSNNHPTNAANYVESQKGTVITDPTASTGYYVGAGTVVIDLDLAPTLDANDDDIDFGIFLGGEADKADAVENIPAALEKLSQSGEVYSMDGKLLMKGATLNSLKTLGRGMYILNGVKVLVK